MKQYFVKGYITLITTENAYEYYNNNKEKINTMTEPFIKKEIAFSLGTCKEDKKLIIQYDILESNKQLANGTFKFLKDRCKEFYPNIIVNMKAEGTTL